MKKPLLLAIAALLSLNCAAVNYFQDGIKWEYKKHHGIPPKPGEADLQPYLITQYLEGTAFMAGKDCLKLYSVVTDDQQHQPFLLTYIHTDGDKVYFLSMKPDADPETGEWLLLFDFGLQPGESTSVGHLFWDNAETNQKAIQVTCTAVTQEQSSDGGIITRMSMSEKGSEGEWIAGIGCTWGYTCNGAWGLDGVGGVTLLKASHNGEILYQAATAGINGATADIPAASDAPCYKTDGTPFTPADKGICIQNGTKRIVR